MQKQSDTQQLVTQDTTKTKFVENIKQWVTIDSQLKLVNGKTKQMRDYKSKLNEEIIQYIQEKKLENIKIQITDGELKIYEKKEYPPLTFAYIEKCLGQIIPDKSHVDYIIQYLKDNREITTHTDIRRIVK